MALTLDLEVVAGPGITQTETPGGLAPQVMLVNPHDYLEPAVLRDGGSVLIRAIRPTD